MCKCDLRCPCIVLGALGIGVNALGLFQATRFSVLVNVTLVVGMVACCGELWRCSSVPSMCAFEFVYCEHERLVLVAFIAKLIEIIPSLIILLGVICDFSDFSDSYKSKNVETTVIGIVAHLLLHIIITYVIYNYYEQLHGNEDE